MPREAWLQSHLLPPQVGDFRDVTPSEYPVRTKGSIEDEDDLAVHTGRLAHNRRICSMSDAIDRATNHRRVLFGNTFEDRNVGIDSFIAQESLLFCDEKGRVSNPSVECDLEWGARDRSNRAGRSSRLWARSSFLL